MKFHNELSMSSSGGNLIVDLVETSYGWIPSFKYKVCNPENISLETSIINTSRATLTYVIRQVLELEMTCSTKLFKNLKRYLFRLQEQAITHTLQEHESIEVCLPEILTFVMSAYNGDKQSLELALNPEISTQLDSPSL